MDKTQGRLMPAECNQERMEWLEAQYWSFDDVGLGTDSEVEKRGVLRVQSSQVGQGTSPSVYDV